MFVNFPQRTRHHCGHDSTGDDHHHLQGVDGLDGHRSQGCDVARWLVLQANYDLKTLPTRGDIERLVPVHEPAAAA